MISNGHPTVLGTPDPPAGAAASGPLAAWIDGAVPMPTGAGVDRTAQRVPQRLAIGPVPLQSAPVGTAVRTHRHAGPVMHRVPPPAVRTPPPLELVEERADHPSHLLVGIADGRPARRLDGAGRRAVERSPSPRRAGPR